MKSPIEPEQMAGEITATDFEGWPEAVIADFRDNDHNPTVGSVLLSETELVRVWRIDLAPGERLGAHRHTQAYFWTSLTDGESIQHHEDGSTRRVSYQAGDTRHFDFDQGQHLLHDLENAGTGQLAFITVEHQPAKPTP
jgi:quercetin dioxygenase-like cupin family protein